MDKKKIISYIRNFAVFVGLIVLTFWIIFKDQDGNEILRILSNSKWEFIAIGLLTMFVFLCMEALNIRKNVKTPRRKIYIFKEFKICFNRIFL